MRAEPGHEVYVTHHTEYHLDAGVCVAVRDRAARRWVAGHLALGKLLSGPVVFAPAGQPRVDGRAPGPGDELCFSSDTASIVTSPLLAVDRPSALVPCDCGRTPPGPLASSDRCTVSTWLSRPASLLRC